MASPSVTYTLTNGTTADASQVMQNLNDLISAMTDGSKSFSIDALTVAGILSVSNTTTSTSTITGALKSAGGCGIAENLWVGGTLNTAGVTTLANATDASSKTAGGTIVSGGLAVNKKLYVGTGVYLPNGATELNWYELGSKTDCTFNGNTTGNERATGKTVKWTRTGNLVTLTLYVGDGITTNATESGMQIRTLPTQIRPATNVAVHGQISMNGTIKACLILVLTSGIIALAPWDGSTVTTGQVVKLPYDSATDGFAVTYTLV